MSHSVRWLLCFFFIASTVGCDSAGPAYQLRGSTPCFPGSGEIETWCDDAGNCELRVSNGQTFSCTTRDTTSCTDAAMAAADACMQGGGSDGGSVPPDGGVTSGGVAEACETLCNGCPGDCWSGVEGCIAEYAPLFPGACASHAPPLAACIRRNACDADPCTCLLYTSRCV